MPQCSSCNADVLIDAKFCPHCGVGLGNSNEKKINTVESLAPTFLEKQPPPRKPDSVSGQSSQLGSGRSRTEAGGYRFPPGTILGERFRIVGPLGRGGMGEVYRADDLKLAQSVALKFLPEHVTEDQRRLDLLYNEVRLARSVSHPSVCRVYDIGEIEGQHFLSMEFIDGEDLSSLLRRIGRLPSDKGIEIARQICGGLYAAHERGVIHLDLKPANIMLDGRGKVRITDFGLARLTMTTDRQNGIVGTPAYMAPEQLAGGAVGEHSDIYALGLIFHEIFTGKPVFRASSIAEMIRLRDQSSPSRISTTGKDIDPVVDKIIERCLSNDPNERPPNVVQIAAALPGGDPLAAAIAAGETPSPELIAASGGSAGIPLRWGLSVLAIFVCLLVSSVFLIDSITPLHQREYTLKPAVLEDRAKQAAAELLDVNSTDPTDSAYGFWYNPDKPPREIEDDASVGSPDGGLEFWYRQSSGFLSANHPFLYARQPRVVKLTDPPAINSGMVGVRLNGEGELREISVVPYLSASEADVVDPPALEPIWLKAFDLAGLDFSEFTVDQSKWTPPWAVDKSFAWVRSDPSSETEILRVEAATVAGKLCYFQVIQPWSTRQWTLPTRIPEVTDRPEIRTTNFGELAQDAFFFLLGGPLLVISIVLAVRNLKAGTTDEDGALKYAGFMLILDIFLGLFEAHHNASPGLEMTTFLSCLINAVGRTVRFWIYYLALEPFVRRIWPKVLVSWNRVLQGRFTDPHVAQEILYGCVCGALVANLITLAVLFNDGPIDSARRLQRLCDPMILGSSSDTIAGVIRAFYVAMPSVFTMLVIIIFRLLTRNNVVAVITFTTYMTYVNTGGSDGYITVGFITLVQLLNALVLIRFGLLALIVFNVVRASITSFPITLDVDNWFFSTGLLGIFIPSAISLLAFLFTLGDKSPLKIAGEQKN
ncbi:MAG: serine/threonine-protein kinase [Planctomycetota bacterium]|nr:serine/threonine-protein kinase [Planctomycetota bacterium]